MGKGIEAEVTSLLSSVNLLGGYPMSLVCNEQGLLVAAAGGSMDSEQVAGLTSLFDDIVRRAVRDLDFQRVDELTLLDPRIGRYVVRPLPIGGSEGRLFLVVQVPPRSTWRRNTNLAVRQLSRLLAPLMVGDEPEPAGADA